MKLISLLGSSGTGKTTFLVTFLNYLSGLFVNEGITGFINSNSKYIVHNLLDMMEGSVVSSTDFGDPSFIEFTLMNSDYRINDIAGGVFDDFSNPDVQFLMRSSAAIIIIYDLEGSIRNQYNILMKMSEYFETNDTNNKIIFHLINKSDLWNPKNNFHARNTKLKEFKAKFAIPLAQLKKYKISMEYRIISCFREEEEGYNIANNIGFETVFGFINSI